VERLAADAMAGTGSEVDLVQELTRVVPARFSADDIGVPGEDEQQLIGIIIGLVAGAGLPAGSSRIPGRGEGGSSARRQRDPAQVCGR
jgi:hypothetical protein